MYLLRGKRPKGCPRSLRSLCEWLKARIFNRKSLKCVSSSGGDFFHEKSPVCSAEEVLRSCEALDLHHNSNPNDQLKMSLSSQQNVALLALFVSVTSSLVLVAGEGNEIPPVGNQVKSQKKGLLTSCIDDSDCLKLGEGNKYACFLVSPFLFFRLSSLTPSLIGPRDGQPQGSTQASFLYDATAGCLFYAVWFFCNDVIIINPNPFVCQVQFLCSRGRL